MINQHHQHHHPLKFDATPNHSGGSGSSGAVQSDINVISASHEIGIASKKMKFATIQNNENAFINQSQQSNLFSSNAFLTTSTSSSTSSLSSSTCSDISSQISAKLLDAPSDFIPSSTSSSVVAVTEIDKQNASNDATTSKSNNNNISCNTEDLLSRIQSSFAGTLCRVVSPALLQSALLFDSAFANSLNELRNRQQEIKNCIENQLKNQVQTLSNQSASTNSFAVGKVKPSSTSGQSQSTSNHKATPAKPTTNNQKRRSATAVCPMSAPPSQFCATNSLPHHKQSTLTSSLSSSSLTTNTTKSSSTVASSSLSNIQTNHSSSNLLQKILVTSPAAPSSASSVSTTTTIPSTNQIARTNLHQQQQQPMTQQRENVPHALPRTPVPITPFTRRFSPPKLTLSADEKGAGVCLHWTANQQEGEEEVALKYEIWTYCQADVLRSSSAAASAVQSSSSVAQSPWKFVGCVNALPLPMMVRLSQVRRQNFHFFAVRALDRLSRYSSWSNVASIAL